MATKKTSTKTKANGSKPPATRTRARKKSVANGASTATQRKAASKPPARTNGKTAKLGRSRIPIDAPLELIFEHDTQAREAFSFLGIRTIRELQKFGPDELIMRLTSPTKQTVGRIRKMLALNNRCLEGDERFAIGVQREQ